MRTSSLHDLLISAIPQRKRVLIVGAPGIGKTSVWKQAVDELGIASMIWYPSIADPTEPKGLPFYIQGENVAKFVPFDNLAKLENTTKLIAVLLDDFPQAPPAVQASFMSLLDRFKDNKNVSFCTAGNRKSDFANAMGILEPIKSRHDTIIEVEPNVEDFTKWGIKVGMPPTILAFLRFRNHLLCDFKPSKDLVNSPCPRTIAAVGNWINDGLSINSDLSEKQARELIDSEKDNNSVKNQLKSSYAYEVLSGAVGEGWTIEFLAFERMRQLLPKLEDILKNPDKVKVPKDACVLFALASGLAEKIDPKTLKNGMEFCNKMPAEFQVLLIRDLIAYSDSKGYSFEETKEFINWGKKNTDVVL